MPLFNRNSLKTITEMWNVVFVMGLESLSMTARGMELSQAAQIFLPSVFGCHGSQLQQAQNRKDEKCACSNKCMLVHARLCLLMNPTSLMVHATSCILEELCDLAGDK